MKFKAKKKDCQLIVKAKTSYGEIIDEKELDRFSRLFLRGFLKPKQLNKKNIVYTGPIGISLYERLKKPITKREFLLVLEQLVLAIQKIQAHNLQMNNLVMNLQYSYINEVTKEVQFIYIPTVSGIQNTNLIDFMEMIAYSVTPDDEEDNNFVSRFIYFFKAMTPFELRKIEMFIAKEDKSVVNTIRKQNAGQSGFMTNKQQHYYEHYNENKKSNDCQDDELTGLLEVEEDTTVFIEEKVTGQINDNYDEATGLLSELNEDDTTKLLMEESDSSPFPTLIRLLTEESISVNKPVFRIGKEKSYVDYFVAGNVAVSRGHVDIITRGNRYYVKDLNSKNHTYINGNEIPVLCEKEIQNGDKLLLGNEEFLFRA